MFENIDVYSLICSVLHLNLNENTNDSKYCVGDGQPSRVKSMLKLIKHSGVKEVGEESTLNSKDSWFGFKMKWYFLVKHTMF